MDGSGGRPRPTSMEETDGNEHRLRRVEEVSAFPAPTPMLTEFAHRAASVANHIDQTWKLLEESNQLESKNAYSASASTIGGQQQLFDDNANLIDRTYSKWVPVSERLAANDPSSWSEEDEEEEEANERQRSGQFDFVYDPPEDRTPDGSVTEGSDQRTRDAAVATSSSLISNVDNDEDGEENDTNPESTNATDLVQIALSEADLEFSDIQDPKVIEILYKRSSVVECEQERDNIQHFMNPDHLPSIHGSGLQVEAKSSSVSTNSAHAFHTPSNSPTSGQYSRFDILDPTIFEYEYHKQLAINARNEKSQLITLVKVLELTLPWLDFKDLFTCRFVCKKWCDGVSSSPEFWNRMHISLRVGTGPGWDDLINSDLCSVYKCPHYKIIERELRDKEARLFFRTKAHEIKKLALTRCVYSVTTLQTMLRSLVNLEHLEITGVDPSVLVAESIYYTSPSSELLNMQILPKLTTLVLEFHMGKKDLQLEETGVVNPLPRNLSEPLMYDLLGAACKQLKIIKLIGWESRTCFNILQLLYFTLPCAPISLEELHFLNIPLKNLSLEDFGPLANFQHSLRLKKLAICLNNNRWSELSPKTDTIYADKIFGRILQVHRNSLTHVYLDHCPVSPNVVIRQMPKVRKFSVHGTNIPMHKVEEFSFKLGRSTVAVAACKYCDACGGYSLLPSPLSIGWGTLCTIGCILYIAGYLGQTHLMIFLGGMILLFLLTYLNSNH